MKKNHLPAEPIILDNPQAKTTVFLIHGYTGAPRDFNQLPEYLHQHHDVRVVVMLLPGHGTSIEDLDDLTYDELIADIDSAFEAELATGRQIIVGGLSFGALVALRLAMQHSEVAGLINLAVPLVLKLPFGIPGVGALRYVKKHWRKRYSAEEVSLRARNFYYTKLHINGLAMIKRIRREIMQNASSISCPVFTVHSSHDPIGSMRGVRQLQRRIDASHEVIIYHNKNHNFFYSDRREITYQKVGDFVERMKATDSLIHTKKIAAIVPAYNESERIADVLKVLVATPTLDEVIVVDDGSSDDTAKIARKIKGVKVIVNQRNGGKSYSLEQGIASTDAEILFFCDADLRDFSVDIVTAILNPVASGRRDMFIGVRNNITQKALTLFALNSGERALNREIWEKMPDFFKYRYRLEVGLNVTARMYGNGFGWKKFAYYQTFKEAKYGFLRGTFLRWWMNADVLYAYFLAVIVVARSRFRNSKKYD